jgi:hypothetical protein
MHPSFFRFGFGVEVADVHRASRVGGVGDSGEQGRFASAVRAHNSDRFAFVYRKTNIN